MPAAIRSGPLAAALDNACEAAMSFADTFDIDDGLPEIPPAVTRQHRELAPHNRKGRARQRAG